MILRAGGECSVRPLDRVARQRIQETPPFELVHGHDPDRLSLTLLAYEAGATMSLDDYCRVMAGMYSVDL